MKQTVADRKERKTFASQISEFPPSDALAAIVLENAEFISASGLDTVAINNPFSME